MLYRIWKIEEISIDLVVITHTHTLLLQHIIKHALDKLKAVIIPCTDGIISHKVPVLISASPYTISRKRYRRSQTVETDTGETRGEKRWQECESERMRVRTRGRKKGVTCHNNKPSGAFGVWRRAASRLCLCFFALYCFLFFFFIQTVNVEKQHVCTNRMPKIFSLSCYVHWGKKWQRKRKSTRKEKNPRCFDVIYY